MEGINHAFFCRSGGVSTGIYQGLNAGLGSGDDRPAVEENRRRMANSLGVLPDHLATPYQIHSADALITDTAWNDERPKADAVVTNRPGLAVGVVTADCGPVLFADPQAGVVAAAHAGWKGALGGVLESTIEKMEQLGAQRDTITAILGPTISKMNYEVGPDFPRPFIDLDNDNEQFFTASRNAGHHMFDLPGYIVHRLERNGVKSGTVGECTYDDETNYYSYRRTTHRKEADYGRQLSAIVLKS